VAVRVLGPLEPKVAGRTLGPVTWDLGGVKPKQVLKLPLLERGRTVPKDRLADRLRATVGRAVAAAGAATISAGPVLHGAFVWLLRTDHSPWGWSPELYRSCTGAVPAGPRVVRGDMADRRRPEAAQPGAHGGANLREPPPWSLPGAVALRRSAAH